MAYWEGYRMEHNRLEARRDEVGSSASASTESARPGALRDARVEAYLDRVLERLPRGMSPTARHGERVELASHLDALVAAHVELGADEDTAVQAALHEFGDARQLGRRLSRACRQLDAPRGGLAVVALFALMCVGFPTFLSGGLPQYPTLSLGPPPLGWWIDLAIPCYAGYLWGRYQPVGARWWAMVVLPLLLGAALPLAAGSVGDGSLELLARGFLLLKWAMVTCGAAGVTVSAWLYREQRDLGHPGIGA
jgi:hypothetical protein